MQEIEETPGLPPGPAPARFSALRFRDFRLFWTGQVVSYSGTWMHSTAQGWLVYSLTKSPFYLGVVSAASWLPILLLSLVGGAVADRFRKRNLLLVTQALSMLPALVIGILTAKGVVTVWHVIALGFLMGTFNAFDIPARQSFLIEMVRKESLLNAVALNSAAFNGARIIGPVAAGLIIEHVGLAPCFFINSASFLAVIVALALMKVQGLAGRKRRSILGEISEGVAFTRREPEVMRPMLLVALFSLFGLPFISLLPVFAEEILGVGASGLGFLAGAAGVGALGAALMLAFRGDVSGKGRTTAAASVGFPAALLVFSLSTNYALSLLALVFAGFAIVSFLALANSSIQLLTPDGLRGRVMSVYTTVFLGMIPIGQSMMGTAASALGTARAVSIGAGVCLAASVVIFSLGRR
ncbi:MAG: MFS transporter [Nitrospirota bacterium]